MATLEKDSPCKVNLLLNILGKRPDGWSWLGMGLIALAGAGSAWLTVREAAARNQLVSALAADTVAD